MKTTRYLPIFLMGVLLLFTIACGFSVSTANIKEAYMAREVNGNLEKVDSYTQEEVFLCVADLANAPDDTVVTAIWYAVDAENTEPNYIIDQVSITGGSNQLFFDLSNTNMLWPLGSYRVDLLVNEELVQSVEFSVR